MTAFPPTQSLADIVPAVRPRFEQLIQTATDLGMQPHIRSAGRKCTDQDAQHSSGSSYASGCRSWHTMGRAIDLDLQPNTYATYEQLGLLWEQMGGFWGGRWTSLFPPHGDYGHFHWGEPDPKTQATPTALCSGDAAACDAEREDYLARAFAAGPSAFPWGAFLLLGAAVAGGAWYLGRHA